MSQAPAIAGFPRPPAIVASAGRARQRKITDAAVKVLAGGAALVGCFMLGWILLEIARRGLGALNWQFFTEIPPPAGEPGGGMASATVGTLMMTGVATLVGVPIGLLGGVFLAEFGRDTYFAALIRFTANILTGVPSIIIGVFVYALLVKPFGHYSGWAGAVALAILMLPVVIRTTEDMLVLVPGSLREAALALGAPRWRVTFQVLFPAAKAGVLTGVILAVARVSGETAPLLWTALNNRYLTWLDQPTANLTKTIYDYASSPYDRWKELAWAASLLITLAVLVATIACRLLIRTRQR